MNSSAQPTQSDFPQANPPVTGGLNKEIEPVNLVAESSGLREVGREVELPPEVTSAGVKIQPTSINIPPPISSLGTPPVNPTSAAAATGLPLSDDQIALGLKQSITSSWRWLAEWCKRRFLQLHRTIRSVGNNSIEVK